MHSPAMRGSFIAAATKLANGRKVHWLGFAQIRFLHHFKPYMCDATTWLNAQRYGELRLYVGRGRFCSLHHSDMSKTQNSIVESALSSYQTTPNDLRDRAHQPRRVRKVRRRHVGLIGLPERLELLWTL